MNHRIVAIGLLFSLLANATAFAQATIHSVKPVSCQPGTTTTVTLNGKDLKEPIRVITSRSDVVAVVEKVEPAQVLVKLTLPPAAAFGPLGLYLATDSGPQPTQIVLVDDLPNQPDNGANHSRESAQGVPVLSAIDGHGDGPQSDFYRFTVTAGQRIAFAVLTQSLHSKMDPVLRLTDASGATLVLCDDSAAGPDCKFSHRFEAAGDYWIEISDSRYLAGQPYHLRIGDFPILDHAFPLAVQRGEKTQVRFNGEDGGAVEAQELTVPVSHTRGSVTVNAKLPGGSSATWLPILVSERRQFVETVPSDATPPVPLTLPTGISGSLDAANERDSFVLQGTKGQSIRIRSRTRSLGCATMLQMELFNAANAKLAGTTVSESDEWGFDFTFPEDGVYRLDAYDLMHRGGAGMGYHIEVATAGTFAVQMKAAAETKQAFALEPKHGVAIVDVTIDRFGYEGEISLSLSGEASGLRILESRIPAGAKESRIYLVADESWKPETIANVRIDAQSTAEPIYRTPVGSLSLHRTKSPHVPFPEDWNDGDLAVTGIAAREPFFALEPTQPVELARPLTEHTIPLALKRINAEFKAAVTVLGRELPAGWAFSSTVDKDTYATKFNLGPDVARPEQLSLYAIAEFQNLARLEQINVPVRWYDPVKLSAKAQSSLLANGSVSVDVIVMREGNDAQPVTITPINLPPGLTAVPDTITVAADQPKVTFTFNAAAEFTAKEDLVIAFQAKSKHQGIDIEIASNSEPITFEAQPVRLEAYPTVINLGDKRARQQLVITGFDDANRTRDWTHRASIVSLNPAIAEVRGTAVYPVADGDTEIELAIGATKLTIPVKVANTATHRPIGFESDVLVALSKQSCNSGACHGSPSGKGSFRLSLRAFDKKLDELTLIREEFGRRVNTIDPENSLLLQKPLMKVAHGGGKQIQKSDEAYAVLRDWIAEGAKPDKEGTARCVRLEISPNSKRILARRGGGQQLAATAHFADGSTRDVTHLVAYESSNKEVATVDHYGRVTAMDRGEAVILVRFLEHIESLPLMFIDQVPGFQWAAPAPSNYIDELVNAKLQQLQFLPSETCSDTEFLRRVYLDVIGALPTIEETSRFLTSGSTNKRSELIDELLARDEYAKFWALKWGDLLKLTGKLVGDEGVHKYHRWVVEAFRTNMPYDRFARELLTSTGSTLANPPANFYRTATDMNECVETISQLFLGARLQCAKCHNHPFERWTQDNYYGLGAFFQRVERKKSQRPGETIVYASFSSEVTQPRTGQIMKPWVPQAGIVEVANETDRREAFADWLVDPKNPYFAKIEVNRIWSHLFARGIVDPIDDFRDSNPPSNEALLDALAKDFVEHGFDRKHILRTMLNSRTYQASCKTGAMNESDEIYFSHQLPRFLSAEQLLDAVMHTTGLTQSFGGLPAGTKATHLPAPDVVKVDFLKIFGQPERSTVCACERADDSNLGMAIELFNGSLVHEKLRDPNNRFRKALAEGRSTEEVVKELYLAGLSREPTPAELQTAIDHCTKSGDVAAGIEDICWALLNSEEFLFQH